MPYPNADCTRFEGLYAIIRLLRGPGGCVWDRKQTPHSMRSSVVEEAYEVIDAIDRNDDANLREEIGDLFLVVSSIVRMKEEAGAFSIDDVFESVCAKLVRRHPHVFAGGTVNSVDDVLEQWEEIKRNREGKSGDGSVLDGIPGSFPPLERAFELQKKAARVGFDWDHVRGILDKLQEERQELDRAMEQGEGELAEEIGDLLFTLVNLARFLRVDPSRALQSANRKFDNRFREMERRVQAEGRDLRSMSLQEMDEIWEAIKRAGD